MSDSRARIIDRIATGADHLVFLFVFIGGAAGTVVLRLLFSLPTLLVMIWPVALLLAYAALVWRTKQFRLREDRAADNLYYLGFLFTVTSLGVALVRFSIDRNPDVNQIVGDLGLGLTTTIVGLVLRIFFTQLRQDPEEIEEQTRFRLADVAEQTRAQLLNANEAVRDIHAQTFQILRNANDQIEVVTDGLIQVVKDLERRVGEIDVPRDLITARIGPALDSLIGSVERFTEKLDTVRIRPTLVDDQVKEAFATLPELVERSVKVIDSAGSDLARKMEAIDVSPTIVRDNAVQVFKPVQASVARFGKALKSVEDGLQRLIERNGEIVALGEGIEKIAVGSERLVSWADSIAANEARLTEINVQLEGARRTIRETETAMAKLAGITSEQGSLYKTSLQEMIGAFDNSRAQVEALAQTVEAITSEYAKSMTELVELTNRAVKST